MTKLMQWHERVMDTPAGELHEMHPLCQEVKRIRRLERKLGRKPSAKVDTMAEESDGEAEEGTLVETVKMPGKLESAKELARLHGWGKENTETILNVPLDQVLAKLCAKGLPRMPKPKTDGA